MRFSKGQGLSMNVIIIAALAIIVLIVLVVVFGGRFRIFGTTVRDCEAQGGECRECRVGPTGFRICECDEGYAKMSFTNCEEKDPDKPVCCISLIQVEENREDHGPPSEEEPKRE